MGSFTSLRCFDHFNDVFCYLFADIVEWKVQVSQSQEFNASKYELDFFWTKSIVSEVKYFEFVQFMTLTDEIGTDGIFKEVTPIHTESKQLKLREFFQTDLFSENSSFFSHHICFVFDTDFLERISILKQNMPQRRAWKRCWLCYICER